MFNGALILESLRVGTRLSDLNLAVREIYRFQPGETSPDQPETWSVVELQIQDADAPRIAQAIAGALTHPGWYADFRSDQQMYVVFPGRVFRYARGDQEGRAEAQAHGRSRGIPGKQLDWPA